MKRRYTKILTALMLLAAFCAGVAFPASAQEKSEKKHQWVIQVRNIVTGEFVGDTLAVDLLRPDSTLILSQPLMVFKDKLGIPFSNSAGYMVPGQDFIIRLSHPDYETAYHKIHIAKNHEGKTLQIRKLTKREKAMMLDEVVVTASVVEFVNKGDTIQFNADAFELAEGSMLSALIKRLPGAELKENGQIYINGKFVDKLLLNGEDFFRNDKLVLLQNLPAYTVKNIQVYEETLPEQLAKKDSSEPDLVMNVKLKKEFNAGWMANAEAGGGTHNRYRLRGFGVGYTPKGRIAAYAFINNLNETGSPDMAGEWQKKSNQRDEIITKGAGLDYNFKPKDNLKFRGNTTIQYQIKFGNSLVNQQNYLPDGVNYSRRWLDNRFGNLSVISDHTSEFTTGKIWHEVNGTFNYGSDKMRSNTTEGTFGRMPGDYPAMRADLQAGMPDTLDILNRYLSLTNTDSKLAYGNLKDIMYFSLPHDKSLTATVWGTLSHRWQDGSQSYLLQTKGDNEQRTDRTNPQNRHDYKYGGNLYAWLGNDTWYIIPKYSIEDSYTYSSTMFYDFADSIPWYAADSPMQLRDRMEYVYRMLDPQNSYIYGLHQLDQKLTCCVAFTREDMSPTGSRTGKFQISIDPGMRYLRRKMNFNGATRQLFSRNTWLPEGTVHLEWHKNNLNQIRFDYNLSTNAPQMMDMLDIAFNSDPLNPTLGNPNLKYGLRHVFNLKYNSMNFLWNKLHLMAGAKYTIDQRAVTYGTSYDMATGIRTTKPMNINGNRYGNFYIYASYRPVRAKNFFIKHQTVFTPARYATFVSTTDRRGMQRSISHSNYWNEWFAVEYNTERFTAAATVTYTNEFNTSRTGDFDDYRIQSLDCGVRGLVRLPLNFEISSNISVMNYRGYTDPTFNKAQVIWNARISKSILGGSLQFAFDGYDMLQQIKKTRIDTTAAYRRETRYNSIPSYFMFTVKYFFSKKLRQ